MFCRRPDAPLIGLAAFDGYLRLQMEPERCDFFAYHKTILLVNGPCAFPPVVYPPKITQSGQPFE